MEGVTDGGGGGTEGARGDPLLRSISKRLQLRKKLISVLQLGKGE